MQNMVGVITCFKCIKVDCSFVVKTGSDVLKFVR